MPQPESLSVEQVAHHEAAHAVAGVVLSSHPDLLAVTVDPEFKDGPGAYYRPIDSYADAQGEIPIGIVQAWLTGIVAGPLSELRFVGEDPQVDAQVQAEFVRVHVDAANRFGAELGRDIASEAFRVAESFVDDHWIEITLVAVALLAKPTLSGVEVRELVATAREQE